MEALPVSIRLNPFKLTEWEGTPVPWNKWGRILDSRPVFTLDPLFHAGAYYVQDSSAMYVGHIFRSLLTCDTSTVLDLCAAPGGKTTDLAASLREKFGNGFTLVSNEVMKQRAGVLRDNVAAWGDPNVIVTSLDPAAFAHLRSGFDIIVADVPCSGEGMFRKDPKAVEQWSEDTVQLCAARQKRIISDVWPALKPGGILIYSTCTYNEQENDDNLEWIARELGGSIVRLPNTYSGSGVKESRAGHLLKAGETLGEGQWVGALVKDGIPRQSGRGLTDADLKPFHPLISGVHKGEYKGRDFVPDNDWALNLDFDRNLYPMVELDRQTALKYLHRDSILLPQAPRGYIVVCYRGLPLGFVKNLGTRCNNLLPQRRRILMDIK